MTAAADWVLKTDASGFTRHFAAEALPVSIGGSAGDDVYLAGVIGSAQVGLLDGVFFLQPDKSTRNLRVNGALVTATRRLEDGDVIALDTARITCNLADNALTLEIETQITAGDTAPPDLDELARGAHGVDDVAITPISFRPGAGAAGARDRGPNRAAIAVAVAFAVLAVLGWFAFTAKSVELRFEPEPSAVELPGYYPLDTEVEIGDSPDQSVALELTKLPGEVTLATQPEVGAEVRLDGKTIGRTPLIADIVPGEHRLEFTAARYLSETRELDVLGGGERQELSVTLTPDWAPVQLRTDPAGAEVLVDGEPSGTTPVELELTAGEHELEVRLPGYNAWQGAVAVTANEPQQLPPVKLMQADGRVQLASEPSEAAVSVDGEFRGRTPLTLLLRPDRNHSITLTKPGYEPVTRQLSVAADSGRRVEVELVAQVGTVEISSDPPEAEVWVDGQRQAMTPAQLQLTAVPHRIEVQREGYATETREVTPRPGFAQTLAFELEALDDTSGSGYQKTLRTSLDQSLTLIPAGEFTMGSSRREQGRRSNEVLRRVKLSRAFYIGVREVSNAEFRAFAADHDSGEFAGISLNEEDQPVVRVTWDDAARFLNWLSVRDGLQPVYEETRGTWVPVRPLRNGYRLPTEAEWAWAARFAERETALVYPWGNELPPPDRSGNFADVAAADVLPTTLVTYNDGYEVSAPSGTFPADAVGVHDLGGNVAEWVQDYYEIDVDPGTEQAVDPLGPETGRFHIVRGPSWRSATVTDLRLAYRDYSADSREDLGFRIARNLE